MYTLTVTIVSNTIMFEKLLFYRSFTFTFKETVFHFNENWYVETKTVHENHLNMLEKLDALVSG